MKAEIRSFVTGGLVIAAGVLIGSAALADEDDALPTATSSDRGASGTQTGASDAAHDPFTAFYSVGPQQLAATTATGQGSACMPRACAEVPELGSALFGAIGEGLVPTEAVANDFQPSVYRDGTAHSGPSAGGATAEAVTSGLARGFLGFRAGGD